MWLRNGVVRRWWRIICRRHGPTDEAQWWVQDIELGRKSLSAKPMCRWLPLDRKKSQGSGNMWTPRRAEKVLSLTHFSWFYSSQEEGKGLRQLTFPNWCISVMGWASPTYLQIPNTGFTALWPLCLGFPPTSKEKKGHWDISNSWVLLQDSSCHRMSSSHRASCQHVLHFISL